MRVLLTASRDWVDRYVIYAALDVRYVDWLQQATLTDTFVVVHGDARGGDQIGKQWAIEKHEVDYRVDHEAHPAQWDKYGRAAGHMRNQKMVDLDADYCEGFPLGRSPGTRGCMRLAKAAGIPVKKHKPRSTF